MTWLILLIALLVVVSTTRLFIASQAHEDHHELPPLTVEEIRALALRASSEDMGVQMAAIRSITDRGGLKDPRMVLALAESPLADHSLVQASILNALKKCAGPPDVETIRASASKLRTDPPIKHEVEMQSARAFADKLDAFASELQARAQAGQWGVVEAEGEGQLSIDE